MVHDIRGISFTIDEPRRLQTVQAFILLMPDQEEIRQIECIRLAARIVECTDRSVDIDLDVLQWDCSMLIRINALAYRKLCRQLHGTMLAAAHAFEHINRKIVADFVEVAAVPVTEFALFVEECDSPP